MKKIKVLHIITGLPAAGTEMMLYKLLASFSESQITSQVVSLTDIGPVGEKIAELGIPTRSLGMRRGIPEPFALIRLANFIRHEQPDIVQTWLYHADLIGGLAAKLAGKYPLVWNIRQSNLSVNKNKIHTLIVAKICALLSRWLPDKIICNSNAGYISHIKYGYAKEKIQIIPNGFDLSLFKPDSEASQSLRKELNVGEEPVIGMIARCDPQKDHQTFIHAAAQLSKYIKSYFALCGAGVDWKNSILVNMIDAFNLRQYFRLLGTRDDTPRITAALDIATSSSTGEGFSNAIGEAMSCEIPCVVTDVGDSKWIVGKAGKVVPPGDPEGLANAWRELLEMSQEDRKELGRNGRTRIEKHFSLPKIASEYEELYLQLLNPKLHAQKTIATPITIKKENPPRISVIIPVYNCNEFLIDLLSSIEKQTVRPDEIVIMDVNAPENKSQSIIANWQSKIPIRYQAIGSAYPGKARNVGVESATGDWIAFIDCKTIPEPGWLSKAITIIQNAEPEVIFGLTIFEADTYFKKLLRAASRGCIPHRSVPGTLIKKEIFIKTGGFISDVRSSEDIEWMNRLAAKGISIETFSDPITSYRGFPASFGEALRKYHIYAMATARTDIFKGQKTLYLAAMLLLLTIFVYKWNWLMTGWDINHPLYIPHIMKGYLAILMIIFFVLIFTNSKKMTAKNNLFVKVWAGLLVILFSGLMIEWNEIITRLHIGSLFFPHITESYIATISLLSILIRGVFIPLKRRVDVHFIFPFQWIVIGLVGICLDIVKIPGYCWGAITGLMGVSTQQKSLANNQT